MDTFTKHQFKIAKDTLHLSDMGVKILGGMSKEEARKFLAEKMGWSPIKIKQWEEC